MKNKKMFHNILVHVQSFLHEFDPSVARDIDYFMHSSDYQDPTIIK